MKLASRQNIGSVGVAINSKEFQNFTIIVIELLGDSKALYKPCSEFHGLFHQPYAIFKCNESAGYSGDFLYIKDNREGVNEFSLCEVHVFPLMGKQVDHFRTK